MAILAMPEHGLEARGTPPDRIMFGPTTARTIVRAET
jgi:hypothetical protein